MPGSSDTVLAEVRQVYGNVVYTHETHEKEAERAVAVDCAFRRTNVIVLGIAVLAAVVALIVSSPVAAWVAVLVLVDRTKPEGQPIGMRSELPERGLWRFSHGSFVPYPLLRRVTSGVAERAVRPPAAQLVQRVMSAGGSVEVSPPGSVERIGPPDRSHRTCDPLQ